MKRRRTWIKAVLTIPVVLIFLAIGVVWWLWGGYDRPTIPNELIPTAEYLLQHPLINPRLLEVFPPVGSIIKPNEKISVCIPSADQFMDREKLQAISSWSRIYLNGQRLPQSEIDSSTGTTITYVGCLEIGYTLQLPSGLHLFRIQVGSSFNDFLNPDPKLSYEWAYRVE